jgi:hypothetical protein
MTAHVDRDERTLVVENVGFRWAYHFLSFGLLAAVGYRSLAHDEAAWDLLSLVVLGGLVASGYQWSHRVLTKRWVVNVLASMLAAAVLAALLAWLRT